MLYTKMAQESRVDIGLIANLMISFIHKMKPYNIVKYPLSVFKTADWSVV